MSQESAEASTSLKSLLPSSSYGAEAEDAGKCTMRTAGWARPNKAQIEVVQKDGASFEGDLYFHWKFT